MPTSQCGDCAFEGQTRKASSASPPWNLRNQDLVPQPPATAVFDVACQGVDRMTIDDDHS
jgi:hypothetical protein